MGGSVCQDCAPSIRRRSEGTRRARHAPTRAPRPVGIQVGHRTTVSSLSGLELLRYAIVDGETLTGVNTEAGQEGTEDTLLKPKGAGGQREPRDRVKERLSEIIRRVNEVFTSDFSDTSKIVFLVHLSETLRRNEHVFAQVRNNKREDALKGDLPQEAMKAVAEAMNSHHEHALELLKHDDGRRGVLYKVLYDLIRNPEYARQLLDLR